MEYCGQVHIRPVRGGGNADLQILRLETAFRRKGSMGTVLAERPRYVQLVMTAASLDSDHYIHVGH
jgi:hypothetical protein